MIELYKIKKNITNLINEHTNYYKTSNTYTKQGMRHELPLITRNKIQMLFILPYQLII